MVGWELRRLLSRLVWVVLTAHPRLSLLQGPHPLPHYSGAVTLNSHLKHMKIPPSHLGLPEYDTVWPENSDKPSLLRGRCPTKRSRRPPNRNPTQHSDAASFSLPPRRYTVIFTPSARPATRALSRGHGVWCVWCGGRLPAVLTVPGGVVLLPRLP